MTNILDQLTVVLVETSHPGNIGAAARAMATMGLSRLVLVQPRVFPSPEASAMASGAEGLLERAVIVPTLREAVADCQRVFGTSARPRHVRWPMLEPRPAAEALRGALALGPCALVFGRERTGLTNAEMDLCHVVVQIPTASNYHSLNLAQAVQVLSYEIFLATREGAAQGPGWEVAPARMEEMEGFYGHLERVLLASGFSTSQERATHIMRRLRRLFDRATPDRNEVNILRGILSEVERWGRLGNCREKS